MQLEYENTADDLIALSERHERSSPAARSVFRTGLILAAGCAAGAAAITGRGGPTQFLGMLIALVVAPLVFVAVHRAMIWQFRRVALSTTKHRGFLCWHRLTLADGVLREESPTGTTESNYEAMEKVVEMPSHFFVYVTDVSAHVIPRQRIKSGDADAFVSELKTRMPLAGARR